MGLRKGSGIVFGCLVLVVAVVVIGLFGSRAEKKHKLTAITTTEAPASRGLTTSGEGTGPTPPQILQQKQTVEELTERYQELWKQHLITRVTTQGSPKVWVDPVVWNQMDFDQKQEATYTCIVALYQQTRPKGVTIEIVDNMTGKRLARWGILGFKVD